MKAIKWVGIVFAFLLVNPPRFLGQNVPYNRLLNADGEPQNWLMYDADYGSQRFSGLKQVTPENVASLRPVWMYQPGQGGILETSPVVADGVMYLATPPSTVTALDVHTGTKLWSWSPVLPEHVITVGLYQTNRGVAVLNDSVYVGTIDDHLVALDAKNGAVRWNVQIADNKDSYAITEAPMAIDGKIIIGVGGSEAAVRGFLDAYDAKTGAHLWRLWLVPGAGEPGSETWGKDMTGTGGASTWTKGSYDPDSNLLYWGTGNPAPDTNGDARPGDNLYSCSLIAVDATTGNMKWYFQFTPHDTHDWDASEVPVLFDASLGGRPRKLVALANRKGFYYVLDRTTGEFIAGVPYVKQTWASGLDSKGRPIQLPNTEPSVEGSLVYPATMGATDWESPSYSPLTKLIYVDAHEMGAVFKKGASPRVLAPGQTPSVRPSTAPAGGGGSITLSGDQAYGVIRALDVLTGKMRWEFKLLAPAWSSTLSTAGGLVFSETDEGNIFALDASTGKLLWEFPLGGYDPRANPITYAVDGKQYVVGAAGNAFVVFSLP